MLDLFRDFNQNELVSFNSIKGHCFRCPEMEELPDMEWVVPAPSYIYKELLHYEKSVTFNSHFSIEGWGDYFPFFFFMRHDHRELLDIQDQSLIKSPNLFILTRKIAKDLFDLFHDEARIEADQINHRIEFSSSFFSSVIKKVKEKPENYLERPFFISCALFSGLIDFESIGEIQFLYHFLQSSVIYNPQNARIIKKDAEYYVREITGMFYVLLTSSLKMESGINENDKFKIIEEISARAVKLAEEGKTQESQFYFFICLFCCLLSERKGLESFFSKNRDYFLRIAGVSSEKKSLESSASVWIFSMLFYCIQATLNKEVHLKARYWFSAADSARKASDIFSKVNMEREITTLFHHLILLKQGIESENFYRFSHLEEILDECLETCELIHRKIEKYPEKNESVIAFQIAVNYERMRFSKSQETKKSVLTDLIRRYDSLHESGYSLMLQENAMIKSFLDSEKDLEKPGEAWMKQYKHCLNHEDFFGASLSLWKASRYSLDDKEELMDQSEKHMLDFLYKAGKKNRFAMFMLFDRCCIAIGVEAIRLAQQFLEQMLGERQKWDKLIEVHDYCREYYENHNHLILACKSLGRRANALCEKDHEINLEISETLQEMSNEMIEEKRYLHASHIFLERLKIISRREGIERVLEEYSRVGITDFIQSREEYSSFFSDLEMFLGDIFLEHGDWQEALFHYELAVQHQLKKSSAFGWETRILSRLYKIAERKKDSFGENLRIRFSVIFQEVVERGSFYEILFGARRFPHLFVDFLSRNEYYSRCRSCADLIVDSLIPISLIKWLNNEQSRPLLAFMRNYSNLVVNCALKFSLNEDEVSDINQLIFLLNSSESVRYFSNLLLKQEKTKDIEEYLIQTAKNFPEEFLSFFLEKGNALFYPYLNEIFGLNPEIFVCYNNPLEGNKLKEYLEQIPFALEDYVREVFEENFSFLSGILSFRKEFKLIVENLSGKNSKAAVEVLKKAGILAEKELTSCLMSDQKVLQDALSVVLREWPDLQAANWVLDQYSCNINVKWCERFLQGYGKEIIPLIIEKLDRDNPDKGLLNILISYNTESLKQLLTMNNWESNQSLIDIVSREIREKSVELLIEKFRGSQSSLWLLDTALQSSNVNSMIVYLKDEQLRPFLTILFRNTENISEGLIHYLKRKMPWEGLRGIVNDNTALMRELFMGLKFLEEKEGVYNLILQDSESATPWLIPFLDNRNYSHHAKSLLMKIRNVKPLIELLKQDYEKIELLSPLFMEMTDEAVIPLTEYFLEICKQYPDHPSLKKIILLITRMGKDILKDVISCINTVNDTEFLISFLKKYPDESSTLVYQRLIQNNYDNKGLIELLYLLRPHSIKLLVEQLDDSQTGEICAEILARIGNEIDEDSIKKLLRGNNKMNCFKVLKAIGITAIQPLLDTYWKNNKENR